MEMSRLFTVLRTHWLAVMGCVVALLALTLSLHLVLPPKYTAMAAIVVDVRGVNPVLGVVESHAVQPRNVLGTQASMVRSEGVARQVVTRLALDKDPALLQDWQDQVQGRGDAASWIARRLLKSLDVRPDAEDSNVLDLQFSSRDAARSAAVVNAFADAYLATALGVRSESARVTATFFTQQAQTLRLQLEEAQVRLSAYQREKGIVGGDERLDVETASLNEQSNQLIEARTQRIDAQSRNQQAAGRASVSPDVLNSPVVQQLVSSVAAATARLKAAEGPLGAKHPQVLAIQDELSQLRAEQSREMERAASALQMSDNINQRRESSIKDGVETQRRRVLALKTQRDGMIVLERDVDSARKAYEQAQLRQVQSSQEGSSPSPEASILTVGMAPAESSRPGLLILMPMALVVGLLLGTLLALLLEWWRPLIHSGHDLAAWGVPVIAVVPRADLPRATPPALRGATA